MILYQLKCRQGHEFEAWFLNSATYDSQQASGDVGCPFCGTTEVTKGMMAPNLSPGRSSGREGAAPSEVRAKQVAEKILEAVDDLREHVEETCDYVGDEFAEEARRIHSGDDDDDGDGEERGIYGEATDEDAEDLEEEGIEFFRLPFLRRRDS